jgi:hypothetical protein
MTNVRIAAFTFLLLFTACSHRVPVATVEVIDTSLSITPRAERAALNAVQNQIAHMQRGDQLVLIPITGDAANDASGRILRLSAPTVRETYDSDLRRFQEQARKQFAVWLASLDPHEMRTDILGTLDVVRQEFVAIPKGSGRLIIVSDFLEDESSYRFVSAKQLSNMGRANALALSLRSEREFALPSIPICLGRLESSDFAHLSPQRKDAVQAFWTEYLTDKNRPPELHFDGAGMLNGSDGCLNEPAHAATN